MMQSIAPFSPESSPSLWPMAHQEERHEHGLDEFNAGRFSPWTQHEPLEPAAQQWMACPTPCDAASYPYTAAAWDWQTCPESAAETWDDPCKTPTDLRHTSAQCAEVILSGPAAPPAAVAEAPGSWWCTCGNKNYEWRKVCNMRNCRKLKPAEPLPRDSWVCFACGNVNFASRRLCNMSRCRAPRGARHC